MSSDAPPDMPRPDRPQIDAGLPPTASRAIARMIVAWAGYEYALTQWMIVAFMMKQDAARIMIGNMDTRAKLDKLLEIYKHRQLPRFAPLLKRLKAKNQTFSIIRNTVCHCPYMGHTTDGGITLLFASNKFSTGSSKNVKITSIPLYRIDVTARFARRVTKTIIQVVPIEPPEEPL